jgi:hypothetical protein
MAKKKISELPAGGALNGTELVPIVQTGTTKRITAQDIANLGNASGVEGSGTINYLAKFTATSTIGNSQIFDNGTNVGIGTASPSCTLDVVANSSNAIHLRLRGRASDNIGQMEFWNNAQSTRYGFIYADNTSMGVASSQSTPIIFLTNTTEKMRITSAGFVGIGTTTPSEKLSVVNGSISTKDNAAYDSAFIEGASGIAYIGALGTTSEIALYNGGSTKVTIKPISGNVLINTTTDSTFKLDVNGTARVSGAAQFSSTITAEGLVKSNQAASGTPIFWANSTNASSFASTLVYGTTAVAASSGFDFIGMEANGVAQFNVSGNGNVIAKGSVKVGSFTTTQINALSASAGMVVFNTTLATLCFYDGSGWRKVSHSNM